MSRNGHRKATCNKIYLIIFFYFLDYTLLDVCVNINMEPPKAKVDPPLVLGLRDTTYCPFMYRTMCPFLDVSLLMSSYEGLNELTDKTLNDLLDELDDLTTIFII